ncbi:MAG: NADH-quinone oxidoreductase subunit H [Spirochaetales bacterium]|nr:NADH-quinone oxidoreductase subunit H [Spirochaetales bacterium]
MEPKRLNKIEAYQKRVNLIFQDFKLKPALEKLLKIKPEEIINTITESNLRGRGGAGYPTGLKWKHVHDKPEKEKYIICNADEGEPGTFKDREILQKQAGKVLFGMTACSLATGAKKGYLYVRGEYNYLLPHLTKAIDDYHKLLRDTGIKFTLELRSGSGAYVCGEETSLIESMEGKRGEARNKPPYPTDEGFLGKPTVINNVETFVYAAIILSEGKKEFLSMGTDVSRGAKVFCVSGDTPAPGIYELELGMKLSDFVDLFGDGDTKAVQVGGSSGFCVPRKNFETTIIGFEGIPTGGSMMLFNSRRSMYNVLHNYLEFFEEESCGQCTPCRVGCQQLLLGIETIKKGEKTSAYLEQLRSLAETMKISAKCGLGQSVPNPFISITSHFGEEITY